MNLTWDLHLISFPLIIIRRMRSTILTLAACPNRKKERRTSLILTLMVQEVVIVADRRMLKSHKIATT